MGDNNPSTAGICNMACAGDANEICGGPNALNIFVKDDYEYTTGPASAVESYNDYENPQCWLYVLVYFIRNGLTILTFPLVILPVSSLRAPQLRSLAIR
jgi:hypothetical protein